MVSADGDDGRIEPMPRRVDPTWIPGELREKRRPDDYLSIASRVVKASALRLPDPRELNRDVAHILAGYLDWKEHAASAPTKARSRRALEMIAAAAERQINDRSSDEDLRLLITNCDDDAMQFLAIALRRDAESLGLDPERVYNDQWRYARHPEVVAQAAKHALKLMGERKGPSRDRDLKWTLWQLADAYEAATGERATHTTYAHTVYKRAPLSAFGGLCRAFFKVAAPDLPETRISTELRLVLPQRKRSVQSRS